MSGYILESNIKKYILYMFFSPLGILGSIMTLFYLQKGLSYTEIMIINGVNGLAIVLFEVPTGALADYYSRKLSVITGIIMWIISFIMLMFAQSFLLLVVAVILFSIGTTFKSGADTAILYDSLKELKREDEFQSIMGRGQSYMFYVSAIGTVIASFLFDVHIHLPFLLLIGFLLVSLIVAMTFVEPTLNKKTSNRKLGYLEIISKSVLTIRNNKKVLKVVLFSTVFFIFFRNAYPFYQPYMLKTGIPVKLFGIIFFSFNMISGYFAKRVDLFIRITKPRAMFSIGFLVSLSFILLGVVHHFIGIIFIFLQQITRGVNGAVFGKYINKNIPSDLRATIISFTSLIGNIGLAISAPLIGILMDTIDIYNAQIISGVIMLITLITVELITNKKNVIE